MRRLRGICARQNHVYIIWWFKSVFLGAHPMIQPSYDIPICSCSARNTGSPSLELYMAWIRSKSTFPLGLGTLPLIAVWREQGFPRWFSFLGWPFLCKTGSQRPHFSWELLPSLEDLCRPAAPDLEAFVRVFSPSFQISFTLQETSRDSFGQRGKARLSMNFYITSQGTHLGGRILRLQSLISMCLCDLY